MKFAEFESQSDALVWFARVPSYSNLSDSPSRGETRELLTAGFVDISYRVSSILEPLVASLGKGVGERA